MTLTGRLRNLWRAWRLQHWAARDAYPARLVRTYGSEDERDRDAKRLAANGYRVTDEVDSGLSLDVAPRSRTIDVVPHPYGMSSPGFSGPMRIDLPLARVTYERDPSFPRRP